MKSNYESRNKEQLIMEEQLYIESEPRTLSIDQIQCAREAAMYVVSTRSIEEAITIFTQGLEPVVCVARDNKETTMDLNEIDYFQDLNLQGLRDVVSAPF